MAAVKSYFSWRQWVLGFYWDPEERILCLGIFCWTLVVDVPRRRRKTKAPPLRFEISGLSGGLLPHLRAALRKNFPEPAADWIDDLLDITRFVLDWRKEQGLPPVKVSASIAYGTCYVTVDGAADVYNSVPYVEEAPVSKTCPLGDLCGQTACYIRTDDVTNEWVYTCPRCGRESRTPKIARGGRDSV